MGRNSDNFYYRVEMTVGWSVLMYSMSGFSSGVSRSNDYAIIFYKCECHLRTPEVISENF